MGRRVPTAAERFDNARTALSTAREDILAAINTVHPDAGECLPVPDLIVPATPEQLQTQIRLIFANLFDPSGNRHHPDWVRARDACDHADADQPRRIFEAIYQWYGLLTSAKEFTRAYASRGGFQRRQEAALALRLESCGATPSTPLRGRP